MQNLLETSSFVLKEICFYFHLFRHKTDVNEWFSTFFVFLLGICHFITFRCRNTKNSFSNFFLFLEILDGIFTSNTAQIYGGAICWFNGVDANLQDNDFMSNDAGQSGGAIAYIRSDQQSDPSLLTSNTFSGNSATVSFSDVFEVADYDFDGIEQSTVDSMSSDLTNYIGQIYDTFGTIDSDLFPFNVQDDLCYVDVAYDAY